MSSTRPKSQKQGRRKQMAAGDAEARGASPSPSSTPTVLSRDASRSPTATPATDPEPVEPEPEEEMVGGPSHAKKGKAKSKPVDRRPRNNFSLTPQQEDSVFEWLQENELLWRRGHRHFKDTQRKKALWEAKGQELEVTTDVLQGWWRGMHTWYVKLHKLKSGQAAKKLTDREKYVMERCAFYEGELRHRTSAPMKPVSTIWYYYFPLLIFFFRYLTYFKSYFFFQLFFSYILINFTAITFST